MLAEDEFSSIPYVQRDFDARLSHVNLLAETISNLAFDGTSIGEPQTVRSLLEIGWNTEGHARRSGGRLQFKQYGNHQQRHKLVRAVTFHLILRIPSQRSHAGEREKPGGRCKI